MRSNTQPDNVNVCGMKIKYKVDRAPKRLGLPLSLSILSVSLPRLKEVQNEIS